MLHAAIIDEMKPCGKMMNLGLIIRSIHIAYHARPPLGPSFIFTAAGPAQHHPLTASLPAIAAHVKVKNAFFATNVFALGLVPAVFIITAIPLESISLSWFHAETATFVLFLSDADFAWALKTQTGSVST